MAPKDSASIDVGYPIMGIKFLNNKTILVAGGGGEGNNGIPNKITAIKSSFKVKDPNRKLQRFREITLPSNEDSPQCIDTAKLVGENKFNVVLGCNQSSQLIKSMNINNNIRKYEYTNEEHLRFVDAAQFEAEINGDADDYPKIVRLAQNNNVGCFMTSIVPSSIYIFNPETLELNYKFIPDKSIEIKDFVLSPHDGNSLCYITSNSINVVATNNTSNVELSSVSIPNLDKQLKGYVLSKVRYINSDELLLAATFVGKKGAVLLRLNIPNKKIIQTQVISKKGVIVSMDVSPTKVAVATNDLALTLINLSNLKVLKAFKNLHSWAITSVSFSPSGDKVASVLASGTLVVSKISSIGRSGGSGWFLLVLLALVFGIVAFLAAVFPDFATQLTGQSSLIDYKFFDFAVPVSIVAEKYSSIVSQFLDTKSTTVSSVESKILDNTPSAEIPTTESTFLQSVDHQDPIIDSSEVESADVETTVIEVVVEETTVVENSSVETSIIPSEVREAHTEKSSSIEESHVPSTFIESDVVSSTETSSSVESLVESPVVESSVEETPIVESSPVQPPIIEESSSFELEFLESTTESQVVQSSVIESVEEESSLEGTTIIESQSVEPPVVESSLSEISSVESFSSEPANVESSSTESSVLESSSVRASYIESPSVESLPVESISVESPSTESPTAESMSVDVSSTEVSSSESPSTDPSSESPSPDVSTVESARVESSSVENPSVETSSVETPSTETPSTETPLTETSSTEPSSAEIPAVESISLESLSVETPSIEVSSAESHSVEPNVTESLSVQSSTAESDTAPSSITSASTKKARVKRTITKKVTRTIKKDEL